MSEPFRHLTVEALAGPWKGSIKIGPFGSQLKREDMVEHGRKVYGQENVIAIDWSAGDRRVSDAKFNALRSCELHPGDVVLSMMGTVGKCAVFPPNAEPGLMDSHLLRIQPNPELVTREYLAAMLQAENVVGRQVSAMSHGSIMAGLSSSIVRRFIVPLPPLSEQPVLSAILNTLDTTIRQTAAIIEKLKHVKQGLLHDLLTRGIDANGELRPPRNQAPHLYKDSPLGWIPREWAASSIDQACSDVVDCPHSTPNFLDDGVLVARTMHIKDGVFLERLASRVSEAEYVDRISRLRPEPGDVVFTREAPVGEAFVIPVGMRICLGQRVMLLRPRPESARGQFLLAQIYSGAVADRIAGLTAGTTNPHLNVAEVRQFILPLPPVAEQIVIEQQLGGLDCRIAAENAVRDKLLILKSGLMDDLLTGRVRVTPLLEAAT